MRLSWLILLISLLAVLPTSAQDSIKATFSLEATTDENPDSASGAENPSPATSEPNHVEDISTSLLRTELESSRQQSRETIETTRQQIQALETEQPLGKLSNSMAQADRELIRQNSIFLQQYLIDIESEQLTFLDDAQNRIRSWSENLKIVLQSSQGLSERHSPTQLAEAYEKAASFWRQNATDLFSFYQGFDLSFSVSLPEKLVIANLPEEDAELYRSYLRLYESVQKRRQNLRSERVHTLNQLKSQSFLFLSESGQVRAKMLELCDSKSCPRARGLSSETVNDLGLELRIVPFRFVAGALQKSIEVRSKFISGLDGWIDLLGQAFFLLCLGLIPWILIRSLRWTSSRIDLLRQHVLLRSRLSPRHKGQVALALSRLSPMVPYVGMIFAFAVARALIENTDFAEISSFLFYAQLYFVYRLFRLVLGMLLKFLVTAETSEVVRRQHPKFESSAAQVSRVLFLEYAALHLVQDTVGRALAYHLFQNLIFWINILVLIQQSAKWRTEIVSASKKRFPFLQSSLADGQGQRRVILFLPLLLAANAAFELSLFLKNYLSRRDLIKRFGSEVFRRRLERADKSKAERPSAPNSYLKLFQEAPADRPDCFIENIPALQELQKCLNDWIEGSPQDLVILVGSSGSGKTTVLERLSTSLEAQIEVHSGRLQSRLLGRSDLWPWLSDFALRPLGSVDDILGWDSELGAAGKKAVLMIDDLENLFLSKVGGFQSYQELLEILHLKTSNLFWVLSVNSRSWAFLKGAVGTEHFYGHQIELLGWDETMIQALITRRHQLSGFQRSFDRSIRSYAANDEFSDHAETQFFRLLWGQSRGNPKVALTHWCSALSAGGDKQVHVGVPAFQDVHLISSLSEDCLFILATIARHRSLSQVELHDVLDLSEWTLLKCLHECESKGVLTKDPSGRYQLSPISQVLVEKYLIEKNFLHG